jgi:hypothetical protein
VLVSASVTVLEWASQSAPMSVMERRWPSEWARGWL